MIIRCSTGPEPDHMVGFNASLVAAIMPKGKNYTWVHMVDGTKHLVDVTFDEVFEAINKAHRRTE